MYKEKKVDGYKIIQNALSQPNGLYELTLSLVPGAIEISRKRIGTKSNSECSTEYSEKHVETFLWALGLMCQEWILENFRRKSMDGHCWTHKQKDGQRCMKGAEFHKKLYEECKKSFEAVLTSSSLE
jgi:hypothetical protein